MISSGFRSAVVSRSLLALSKRRILSAAFAIDKDWSQRHAELNKLGLGGDYEWISAVQKKFIGGGFASAVDVDAAICVAEQKDQVSDVVDLIYKLRHSENAADLPPSAEYALIRLLLSHDPDMIFKLADDPINYGVFLNEHSACLAIDHFLKRDNVQGAARLAAWNMQQEMTNNQLLNLLGLYSCARWAELPADEQTMPREEVEEEEVGEDDMKTFKFPYLKNPCFDGHFDLEKAGDLAGKTLMWLARDCQDIDQSLRESLRLLGAVLYNRLDLAETLVSSSIDGSVAAIIRTRLAPPTEEGAEPIAQHQRIIDGLAACQESTTPLSGKIMDLINKVRESEETSLCEKQKAEFASWNLRRQELIRAQAERVLLKVRAEEIAFETAELEREQEKMSFFENRLRWEKRAAENNEISEETSAARRSGVASS